MAWAMIAGCGGGAASTPSMSAIDQVRHRRPLSRHHRPRHTAPWPWKPALWFAVAVVASASLALASVGCKNEGATPAPEKRGAAEATAPAAASRPRPAAPAPKAKITTETVRRYLDFEKDHRAMAEKWLEERNGAVSFGNYLFDLEPKTKPLREKWGITVEQENEVGGLIARIANERVMWERMGKAQLPEMERIVASGGGTAPPPLPANASPEQKTMAESMAKLREANLANAKRMLVDLPRMRDLSDLREEYGSDVVDYADKNATGDYRVDFPTWIGRRAVELKKKK
jgi:hypothetical protein